MLGNYGTVIDLDNYSNQSKFVENDFEKFVTDLSSGVAKGLFFLIPIRFILITTLQSFKKA
jgi:hypothetical protein